MEPVTRKVSAEKKMNTKIKVTNKNLFANLVKSVDTKKLDCVYYSPSPTYCVPPALHAEGTIRIFLKNGKEVLVKSNFTRPWRENEFEKEYGFKLVCCIKQIKFESMGVESFDSPKVQWRNIPENLQKTILKKAENLPDDGEIYKVFVDGIMVKSCGAALLFNAKKDGFRGVPFGEKLKLSPGMIFSPNTGTGPLNAGVVYYFNYKHLSIFRM